jgi:hypothetical protein
MTKQEQDELLHVASCMRAALHEMISTFEQPRFCGAYPECLERSRMALAIGTDFLDRPAPKPQILDMVEGMGFDA